MRTVIIRRCSPPMKRVLALAKKADVALRTANGDEILLSMIDDFDYEVAAQRRNTKLMAFLKERFRRARKEKGISMEEVRLRLGLQRRPRNGRAPGRGQRKTVKTGSNHEND